MLDDAYKCAACRLDVVLSGLQPCWKMHVSVLHADHLTDDCAGNSE